ncbi:NAD(P)/FAD-dependent oxidoreductase [Pseudonocardia pini]|uniref:NAD(P)/FAD-dependent oxidoreductase n=1 Tax=Pseudonocardia pini TaxID=2758030 RepID=UPI0015F0D767|nr:tryptophan 7-halogenase [Pseudonocardia pini]
MRSVVVGGGFAGLLAAHVLAERGPVTLVERDPAGGARRGVPQGRHLHGLLDRGRRIAEQIHPGFTADLLAAGALTAEPLARTRWFLHGRRLHPTATGLTSVLASRPLIEDVLRHRTLAELHVGTASGVELDAGRVRGVRLADGSMLPADLVVDASGRASRLPDQLAELGVARPREDRVDVDLGYATRTYRRRPHDLGGDLNALVSTVPRSRGGGAMAVEGERWLVTLAGILGDHPPLDDAGFRAFAASLPTGPIGDLVAAAEPLDEPVPYRFRGSRHRRYDLLRCLPEGLLVLGDAVCSLNPLYAQGMTLAAQQVEALRTWDGRRTRELNRSVGRLCAAAWEIATRADLGLPEVAGSRPLPARVLDGYVTRVQRVAHADPVVARALIRVANLADPSTVLLTPPILRRVLRPGADATVAHEERVEVPA